MKPTVPVREGFGEEVRFILSRKGEPTFQRVWKGFLGVDRTMSEKACACIQKGTAWQGHLAHGVQLPRPSLPRPGLGLWADHEQVDKLEPLQINTL